ncbi:thioredoxin AAED1, chloroplastic [Olea europaea subsp. europaea]|uniref:Thioredoxin AAED1, chloroplastic n=1 Tax=Olea europaea subsp. europaea TaxID=158383 RepID=A0A8S0VNC9_OLEEU|nr:thioredoxin AAED1, chloroplastic [Olea europaea subsp. europaea]
MAISLSATTPYGTVLPNRKVFIRPSSHYIVSKPSPKFNYYLEFPHLQSNSNFIHSPSKRLLSASATSSSSGSKTATVSEDTTNLLDTVQVFDLNGNGIPISNLWKNRKAVVAFARHFGCVLCRKRADYLAAEKDKMDAAGVALVLIGPGSVDQARAFSNQTKFEGVYADPSYSSYEALRFVSGVSTTFTPGVGQSSQFLQQGGVIVAGPGKNNISYIHRDKEAGDDPDIKDILKACCLQGN